MFALSAHAGERIRPTLDLSAFRVKIQWVQSALDLEKVRGQYEPRPASDSGTGERVKGFSILVQNKITGAYTCRIFVYKPVKVDDDRTITIGHELLHCALGRYH